jgi:hypothetical protein
MKKTAKKPNSTKTKTPVKHRAASKPKATAVKKTVAKKSVKRKGVVHHAKRIYRLTPKFVHGVVVGAFVGILVVTSLGVHGSVAANPAPDDCLKNKTSQIRVNDVNANVDISALSLACGNRTLILKAWYAPDASGGKPQWLYKQSDPATVGPTSKNGLHMNIRFNTSCYYQVDLVDVTNPQTPDGYPIVRAALGGTKNCQPDMTHTYSCEALLVTPHDGRSASIDAFRVRTHQATFTTADVAWGDGATVTTPNVQGLTHTYGGDGTYTVSVTPHFTYTNNFQKEVSVVAQACQQVVSFTSVPPSATPLTVCELKTKKTIVIDEKLFGSEQYPSSKYTTDLDKCVVKTPTKSIVTASAEKPSKLANTGPGAILIILALAMVGGTLSHRTHKHIQHRRARHHG